VIELAFELQFRRVECAVVVLVGANADRRRPAPPRWRRVKECEASQLVRSGALRDQVDYVRVVVDARAATRSTTVAQPQAERLDVLAQESRWLLRRSDRWNHA